MRASVTLEAERLRELRRATKQNVNSKAVMIAIEDYLKRHRFRGVKRLIGKVDFNLSAEEIRHDR